MGNFINVDLKTLRTAKKALVDYSIEQSKYVNEIKSNIADANSSWNGDDSFMFMLKWNGMSASDGVFTLTEQYLKSYKSILSSAYKAYKQAQSESVEQASKIGGW